MYCDSLLRQLDEETLLKVLEERGLVDQVMRSLELPTTKPRSPKIEIQSVSIPRDREDRVESSHVMPQKSHTHSHLQQGAGEFPCGMDSHHFLHHMQRHHFTAKPHPLPPPSGACLCRCWVGVPSWIISLTPPPALIHTLHCTSISEANATIPVTLHVRVNLTSGRGFCLSWRREYHQWLPVRREGV